MTFLLKMLRLSIAGPRSDLELVSVTPKSLLKLNASSEQGVSKKSTFLFKKPKKKLASCSPLAVTKKSTLV